MTISKTKTNPAKNRQEIFQNDLEGVYGLRGRSAGLRVPPNNKLWWIKTKICWRILAGVEIKGFFKLGRSGHFTHFWRGRTQPYGYSQWICSVRFYTFCLLLFTFVYFLWVFKARMLTNLQKWPWYINSFVYVWFYYTLSFWRFCLLLLTFVYFLWVFKAPLPIFTYTDLDFLINMFMSVLFTI